MSRIWVVIALIYRRARSKPLVEQLVDQMTRRLATMLADRPTHRCEQAQLGVDGLQVAHVAQRERPASAAQLTRFQPPTPRLAL